MSGNPGNGSDSSENTFRFWRTLKAFWPQTEVAAWMAFLNGKTIESAENNILLSPDAYSFWGGHYYALNPISLSPDKRTVNRPIVRLTPKDI